MWFRESCRRQAELLGVAGRVANRADGTVEAVFEGSTAAVERAVAWCHTGPTHAEVTHVEVSNESPQGLSGFRVS